MKLDEYLNKTGMTHSDFAKLIGCEQPTVTRYVKGRIPSRDVILRISQVTNGAVTPNDFYDLPACEGEQERFASVAAPPPSEA